MQSDSHLSLLVVSPSPNPPLKLLEDLKRPNTSDGVPDGVAKEQKGGRRPRKKSTYEDLRAKDEHYRNNSSHEKMLAVVIPPPQTPCSKAYG